MTPDTSHTRSISVLSFRCDGMHLLPRRYLLEHDRSCQLYVVFRRMDYVWTRIDLLFSHEGLSSWHMEDYG